MPARAPGLHWLAALAVVLFAFVAYWPLAHYFLAQDDFTLLERGARGSASPGTVLQPNPPVPPAHQGGYFFLRGRSSG
jgi:hypothetical protein